MTAHELIKAIEGHDIEYESGNLDLHEAEKVAMIRASIRNYGLWNVGDLERIAEAVVDELLLMIRQGPVAGWTGGWA